MESETMRVGRTKKTGLDFEKLIVWIQKSVHKRAQIRLNDKLEDIDTGKQRQVDITIRLSDGPTEFLGIVEVRDHSRPIGVRYVEEISGKRRSVKADAAFLVSRSGFTKTALAKASQVGIRTLTYEEAQNANWSGWLQCRTFTVLNRKYDDPVVFLFEFGTNNAMDLSSQTLADFKEDPRARSILDEQGTPILSFPDLVSRIVNMALDTLYKDIPEDGTRAKRGFLFQGTFEPSIWLETEGGVKRRIGKVGIEAEFYWEKKEYPLKLMRYRASDSTDSIAELATTNIAISGKRYKLEILAPDASDYIPPGTRVSFRFSELNGSE